MNGLLAGHASRPASQQRHAQIASDGGMRAAHSNDVGAPAGTPLYLQAVTGAVAAGAAHAGGGAIRPPANANQTPPASSPSRAFTAHGVVAHMHTDSDAGAFAASLGAQAATLGAHAFFAPGAFRPGTAAGDSLIRHELAHVAQAQSPLAAAFEHVSQPDSPAEREADLWAAGNIAPIRQHAPPGTIHRHPIITTTAERHAESDVVGTVPGTGMTLEAFDTWSSAQLDWFIGISESNRAHLWRLRALLDEGEHIRSGLGAIPVRDLIAIPAAGLDPLRWYAAGSVEAADTVHITAPTAVAADALDLGAKMHALEPLLGGVALRIAMPQTDFEALAHNAVWWQRVLDYATSFQPQLEVAAEMPSFRSFIAGADPLTYVAGLRGHMRNLHRFTIGLLNDEVRLWGTRGTRTPPVTLALQGGHDWGLAFEHADRVLLPAMAGDPRFRLLIVEGPDSLAAAQASVEDIAANFGPIRDVFIIGHGESRQIGLANAPGTLPRDPSVSFVRYPEEELNLAGAGAAGGTPTTRFFDALLRNMDPGQARVVFLGCLVGTTEVPQQIADPVSGTLRAPTDAEIRAFYADPQRIAMREWLERRPASLGLAGFNASFVTGARADTGISAMTSLTDPASGRPRIGYAFDPVAYGSADGYVRTGLEPTGVLRALRELMVSSQATAVAAINFRVGHPVPARDPWWSAMSNAMASLAQPEVLAANLEGVHALEAVAQHVFLSLFMPGPKAEALASLSAAHAAALFPVALATLPLLAPPLPAPCRLVIRRAWAIIDPAQVANFATELDTTPLLAAAAAPLLLPRARIAGMLPTLLPLPAPVPPTRGQLLLAFALAHGSPPRPTPPGAGDPRELQFLHNVAAATRSFPAPVSATLLAGFASESVFLEAVGLGPALALAPAGPAATGATDRANARLGGPSDATNDVFIHGAAYTATIVPPAVNVRARPSLSSAAVHHFRAGDSVRVLGVVHDWAAVEYSSSGSAAHRGRLGFIRGDLLSPPPTP